MEKIRIAIIDDERLIREGLKIILSTFEDIEIVALGENGSEALELCRTLDIDLVLMDIRMPVCDGVKGTKLIKDSFPEIKVLILTTFSDIEYIQDAIKNGASGYLLKDSSYDLIYDGIKAAISGNIVIHPDIANNIFNHSNLDGDVKDIKEKFDLNKKEIDIIKLVSDGLSNKEIANELFLSEGTIKNNVSTILSKLNIRDRTQIVVFAFKNKLTR